MSRTLKITKIKPAISSSSDVVIGAVDTLLSRRITRRLMNVRIASLVGTWKISVSGPDDEWRYCKTPRQTTKLISMKMFTNNMHSQFTSRTFLFHYDRPNHHSIVITFRVG